MTTAKRRAIDRHRRKETHQRKLEVLGRDEEIKESGGRGPDPGESVRSIFLSRAGDCH